MTDRVEQSLKLFAALIDLNLTKYVHEDSEYDLVQFIEHAEKYVKNELKTAYRWCPGIIHE